MTSPLDITSNFARRPLSDGLVGPVLPRGADSHFGEHNVISVHTSTRGPRQVNFRSMHGAGDAPVLSTGRVSRAYTEKGAVKRTSVDGQRRGSNKTYRRLEQCRLNQQRYRERKRSFQMNIAQSIQQLREEIEACKRRRLEIAFGQRNNRSPWCIVADIFHLLERSFASPWCIVNDTDARFDDDMKHTVTALEESFALDVAIADLCGVDKLLSQLHKYSQYFSNPKVHLMRVEEIIAGIVMASAKLNLTVSEFTLRSIFPHLLKVPRSKYDPRLSAGDQLVGQTLECNCSMTLYFDDESGRIARLEISIDWVSALHRVLGKAEDVAKVLHDALITHDCIIGGTLSCDSDGM